ncbi:MAG TPA: DUF732 domain-containing protein [Mycobacteriales bacterium]|nr:DUF732 domain-containing protein [Mycobacteriales bacterium]
MTTQHTRTAIATSTCLTLGVAVAVAVGAVPQVSGSSSNQRVASVSAAPPIAHSLRHQARVAAARHAVHHARRTAHLVHAHVAAAPTSPVATSPAAQPPAGDLVTGLTVQPAAAATPSPEAANIKHRSPKHKKHHKKKAHHHKKPAKPALAPRTTPSAAAVSNAIAGLRSYVHTPFTPTSAQVAEFGDEVCSAFDQNETFSHVKSLILAKVKQLPFTTVTAGAADYVVKTAVALYCPGYKSKVS